MSDGRIDVVLPLAGKDVGRLRTLGTSLRKFWHVSGCLRVFSPDSDAADVAVAVSKSPLVDTFKEIFVVKDSELLKRPQSRKVAPNEGHWWQQQVIKILAAERVDTSFYMILDADCFAVRHIEHDDLVKNGRGLVAFSEDTDTRLPYFLESSRPIWYEGSRKVLQLPPAEPRTRRINVTPFLMSQALALYLRNRLQALYSDAWVGTLLMLAQACDQSQAAWTEYTLYELHSRFANLWDSFHIETDQPLMGNALWQPHQVPTWDARASFEPAPRPFFFSLVQSHTGLPPEWTWERVAPFLDG
jgi:hypothetical protein